MTTLIKELKEKNASCLVSRGYEIFLSYESGIKPLLNWLEEDADFFRSASVADKIIGRAASLLLIYGGASSVYGDIMSEGALAILQKAGIYASYGLLVEKIMNRRGDDICPMEKAVFNISEPLEAYDTLRKIVLNI